MNPFLLQFCFTRYPLHVTRYLLLTALCVFLATPLSYAALPEVITYQGHVVDSQGEPLVGPFDISFRIYDREDASVGQEIWLETQAGVSISDGNFSVKIGNASAQSAHPLRELAFDKPYWLGIEIASLGELSPRQTLDAVPFAYRVHNGVTLSENQTITGDKNFTGTTTLKRLTADAAVGDMFFQGLSGIQRLQAGVSGQVLKSNGSGAAPSWQTMGVARLSEITVPDAVISSTSYVNIPGLQLTIQADNSTDVFLIMFTALMHHTSANHCFSIMAIDGSNQIRTERSTPSPNSNVYWGQSSHMMYAPGNTSAHTINGRSRVTSSSTTVKGATITVLKLSQ